MNKIPLLLIILLSFALPGCINTPQKTQKVMVLEVSPNDVEKYWILKNTSFVANYSRRFFKKGVTEGRINVKYTIDSNGRVSETEIIDSVPEGAIDKAGLKALSKLHYFPSSANTTKTPVRTTLAIEFSIS